MMIVILTSFITMVNAGINTISKMSVKASSRQEEEADPPKGIQIFWGVLMGAISLIFCLAGGINGAKSVKMLVGIPIIFLEVIAGVGFLRMFFKKKYVEVGQIEGNEALKNTESPSEVSE